MHRSLRPAAAAVLALATLAAGRAAHAVECDAPPAPSGLTAVVSTDYFGQTVEHVAVRWTPPPDEAFDHRARFLDYRMERRDDSEQGDWEEMPYLFRYSSDDAYYNFVGDPWDGCTNCAEPGHTYSYRVVMVWRYGIGCDEYVSGEELETPSNVAQVTIPGGTPMAQPPENVRAVSDPDRPRVTVTWDAPEGKVSGYVVRRRRVVPPGKAPVDDSDGAWIVLARLRAATRKFVDLRALPQSDYQYDVAAAIDEQLSRASDPDAAQTPPGKCARPEFNLWLGAWQVGDLADRVGFFGDAGSASRRIVVLEGLRCDAGEPRCEMNTEAAGSLVGSGPKRLGAATSNCVFKVAGADELWTLGGSPVQPKAKGTIALSLTTDDRFAAEAFTVGTITAKAGIATLSAPLKRLEGWPMQTRLCMVFGRGATKAQVGQPVAFLVRTIALGPHPLLAGQVRMTVEVDADSELLSADGNALARKTASTATSATFELGAIGPVTFVKSEEAVLALTAARSKPGQLKLTVKFDDYGDPERQAVSIPADRYCEVAIDPAKTPAAK